VGFTSLFNGKDFTGWKIAGPAESSAIEDGAIAPRPGQPPTRDGPFQNHTFRNFG
jgi:hypothetical protein